MICCRLLCCCVVSCLAVMLVLCCSVCIRCFMCHPVQHFAVRLSEENRQCAPCGFVRGVEGRNTNDHACVQDQESLPYPDHASYWKCPSSWIDLSPIVSVQSFSCIQVYPNWSAMGRARAASEYAKVMRARTAVTMDRITTSVILYHSGVFLPSSLLLIHVWLPIQDLRYRST